MKEKAEERCSVLNAILPEQSSIEEDAIFFFPDLKLCSLFNASVFKQKTKPLKK